jgi:5-methylcytosine-specific restriction endonuclease McrA
VIRRSPIKKRKKRARVLWRSGRVILDAKGMAELREQVYERSLGRCENCGVPTYYQSGHLHHVKHRSAGGSDTLENSLWLCVDCHVAHHNGKGSVRVNG